MSRRDYFVVLGDAVPFGSVAFVLHRWVSRNGLLHSITLTAGYPAQPCIHVTRPKTAAGADSGDAADTDSVADPQTRATPAPVHVGNVSRK